MRTLLVVMVLLLLVPGFVLASSDSSTLRSKDARVDRASPAAEQLRSERRESFRHTGCSKGKGRFSDSSV